MSATDSHPPERESLDPEVDAVDLCASLRGDSVPRRPTALPRTRRIPALRSARST